MNTGRFIRDTFHFFSTFSFRKGWNLILIRSGYFISLLLRKPVVWGLPHTLSVEPVTRCNLSCPECPVGNHTLSRPGGEMSFDLYRRILDQAGSMMHLILYFQGEPFLAHGLFDMITYAKKRKLYVSTSTNGHFLDPENNEKILASGLDRLIISLDGTTQESYEKYRVGGDLAKVTDGIRDLIKRRKEKHSGRPYIILQFLMFRHNLQEIPAMKKLAADLGADRLEFKTAQFYDLSTGNSLIPDDPAYARYRREGDRYVFKYKLKNRCPRLWNTAVTTWDGRMVPCCFDKNAEFVMGDLTGTSLREIWFSEPYARFRARILTAREEVEMCRNCTEGLG